MGLFKLYTFIAMSIILGFKFHKLYQQLDEDITLLLQGCTICHNTAVRRFFFSFFSFFFLKYSTYCRIIYIKVTLKSSNNTLLLTQVTIYNVPNLGNNINR